MHWLKAIVLWLGLLVFLGLSACDPTDDERCGDGNKYVFDKDHCNKLEDESPDITPDDPEPADAGASDGAVVADLPTGMGEICTTDADCAGYDADFCPFNPETGEGSCTIKDCIGDNDGICPPEWRCCDFPEFIPYPPFCVPAIAWDDLDAQMGCTG